jgi:diaminopimelate epimerase
MTLQFTKYQGTGNDFIIFDNREGNMPSLSAEQVHRLCDRHFGIGADGLMLMNRHEVYDFEMIYYNADGNISTMCGNGGRCMIRFAYDLGIHQYTYRFLAADGLHEGEIDLDHDLIRLKMSDVKEVQYSHGQAVLHTGSPHFVKFVHRLEEVDVVESGRLVRYSKPFETEGVNVNFVENINEDTIQVRTYERGVEDETLSCGTGVTAAALVSAHNQHGFNKVNIKTPGGHLSVEFDKNSDSQYENIWLIGPACKVFEGSINI